MSKTATSDVIVAEAIAAHAHRPGALLPILHDIQDRLGHVPAECVPGIARALNLSRAEVHGVVSFYHHFRTHPPGKHVIQLCRAEACQANGANHLIEHAQRALGVEFHGVTSDGRFTLEPVYCLGNCACSPSMMIDNQLHGRVTPERFDAVVENLEKPS